MKCRILIVEDDINYRFAIKEIVPWEQNGFVIAGEAIHGKQAMEFLKKNKVDIVLTDMSMPLMNGVELTKNIKKEYPEVIVIALSAYDDFQFVKESLKYGAKDYILKQDMKPVEMLRILSEAFTEKRTEKKYYLEEQIKRNSLIKILHKENVTESEISYFKDLLKEKSYFILKICGNQEDIIWKINDIQPENILYSITDGNGDLVVLLQMNDSRSTANKNEQIRSFADKLINKLSKNQFICISKDGKSITALPVLYAQILDLEEIRSFSGNMKIFLYYEHEWKINKRDKFYLYSIIQDKLVSDLSDVKKELLILNQLIMEKMPSIENVDRSYYIFCSFYIKNKINKNDNWDSVVFYKKLCNISTIAQKAEFVYQTLQEFWNKFDIRYKGKSLEIINALKYINQNYMNDISLCKISEFVGLSENYFSNLFKAEMSENLITYINNIRIEHAKHLMDTTNMKVYEIAEAVGYNNATYFSTTFKKVTNMAVTEYKKSIY
jgi:Response regulator containing CheY-like receiver domain and AraC-type DNA-binding domain